MVFARSKQVWGLQDKLVFDAALDVLQDQSSNPEPFGLVIETNNLRVVKCSNWLLAQFLDVEERDGLLENTIVVVQSHHLTMKPAWTAHFQERTQKSVSIAAENAAPNTNTH